MAGRATTPPSVSVPTYNHNQQSQRSSRLDPFGPRGRSRGSGGTSSGSNSRDHSVESRGDRSVEFRGGRWGSSFGDEGADSGASFEGRGWGSSPKGRNSGAKWVSSGADGPDWRANRQVLAETGPRNGSGRGMGRGFGSERRNRRGEVRGDFGTAADGSGSWGNGSQKKGAGRFGGARDSFLDSPRSKGSRSSGRNSNRQNGGNGRNPIWVNGHAEDGSAYQVKPNRSSYHRTRSAGRDSWSTFSSQDARVFAGEEYTGSEASEYRPREEPAESDALEYSLGENHAEFEASHFSSRDELAETEGPEYPVIEEHMESEVSVTEEPGKTEVSEFPLAEEVAVNEVSSASKEENSLNLASSGSNNVCHEGSPKGEHPEGLDSTESISFKEKNPAALDLTEVVATLEEGEAPGTPSLLEEKISNEEGSDDSSQNSKPLLSPQFRYEGTAGNASEGRVVGASEPVLISPGLKTPDAVKVFDDEAPMPSPVQGRRISLESKPYSEDSPRTPASQGLRADAEEYNPETSRLSLIRIPQIVSLRAEAAEFNPESPKDVASPSTRRSTDWYEICLEEEEEEDRQALANPRAEETVGEQLSYSSPFGNRGEYSRRKSTLSRNTSGRKLDEHYSNGSTHKKEFGRRNSFGSKSNGKKRDDAFSGPSKRELRRAGSFSGRDAGNENHGSSFPKGKLGKNRSFSRDYTTESPQIPASPKPGKGEFKPWISSREDHVELVQPSRSSAQRNGDLRGEKYVPLALRRGRTDLSSLKPPSNLPSPRGRKSGEGGNFGSPREDTGRWRKEPVEPVSSTRSTVDAEDLVSTASEPLVQKHVSSAVRPAAFFRALNEATDGGDDESLPQMAGTCPDMCPVKERLQREKLRDLAVFERVNGDMKRTSKELAVKKFCRTVVATELKQSDIRPLNVLWGTLQYLLGLLDDPEYSYDVIHSFLFDRTRAIRQELSMQRIRDFESVTIHEEVVRFHILSQHELSELNRKRSKQLDTYLNLQQLSKSLYSLINLYITLGEEGLQFERQAEFYGYYVLLNLGNHGQFQAEPLSLWLPNVPSDVLLAPPMQFARKVLRNYRSNNFVGFFRLVKEATYLQACLMELFFDAVRATSLATLNAAEYKHHPFPLVDLAELIILREDEVEELCSYYGLLTGLEKTNQQLCLFVKQSQFTVPEKANIPQHSCPLIDRKRGASLFEEVKGFTPQQQ